MGARSVVAVKKNRPSSQSKAARESLSRLIGVRGNMHYTQQSVVVRVQDGVVRESRHACPKGLFVIIVLHVVDHLVVVIARHS